MSVTPQKTTLADLRKQADLIPAPLAAIEIQTGRPLVINEPMYELFGVTPESLADDVRDYYRNPEQRASLLNVLMSQGEVSDFEVEMQGGDRKPFWVQMSAKLVEVDGVPVNLTILNDITRRKKVEQKLAVSERNLRNVFETVPMVMAITALSDGLLKRLNPAGVQLFGVEDILDTPIRATDYYVNPDDRVRLFNELKERGFVNDFELQMHNIEGEIFDLLMHAAPVEYNGEPHLLTSFANITDQKALLRKLEQATADAESANRAKSKFLAAASHDLRQPMHALNLFMELIRSESLTERQHELVERMGASLAALNALLDALLDISKLDSGAVIPEETSFSLGNLLLRLGNEFKTLADEKNIELNFSIHNSHVFTDPVLLENILRNLLSNSIRYTQTGSVSVDVEIRTGEEPRALITVSDTGIGIPPDQQEAVFTEFYQIANPERDRSKGLGLGLAIVKRISQLLGLTVRLKSEPGQGTHCTVEVPLVAQPQNGPPAVPPPTAEIDLTHKTVYFIDDQADIREATREVLTNWGCSAIVSGSEEEAVNLFRDGAGQPDIVISDYRLRDNKNGLDAIRRLQQETGRNIPAIIVTGDLTAELIDKQPDTDLLVLHKPIEPKRLRDAMKRVLAVQTTEH